MTSMDQYLTVCRYVIGADLDNPATWAEVRKLLIGIRQSLTCCVCGGLLNQPTGPARSLCCHHVCKRCVGNKMRYIKRGCGWCKSFEEFVPNRQLDCVIRCFRRLCQYLRGRGTRVFAVCGDNATVNDILAIVQEATDSSCEISPGCSEREFKTLAQHSSPRTPLQDGRQRHSIVDVVNNEQDADSEIRFKFRRVKRELHKPTNKTSDNGSVQNGAHFNSTVSSERISNYIVEEVSSFISGGSSYTKLKPSCLMSDRFSQTMTSPADLGGCDNDKKLENFVLAEHDYNKFTSEEFDTSAGNFDWTTEEDEQSPKRTTSTDSVVRTSLRSKFGNLCEDISQLSSVVNEFISNDNSNNNSSSPGDVASESNRRRCKMKGNLGCRCALATPNPGKLTCCGQRCPCYAAFKGCNNCKCRGCRNPRGDPNNVPSSLLRVVASSPPVIGISKLSTTVT